MNSILKNARKKNGLKQSEVAKMAGISVLAYQRYEYGDRIPNAVTAILIAKAVNSTVEELFAEYLEPE